jgi:hypothetical protein
MATVLLAHFFTSLQKTTEVAYFRTAVLYTNFVFSPPPVLNVTEFRRNVFLREKNGNVFSSL